jgi:hypothetical protein
MASMIPTIAAARVQIAAALTARYRCVVAVDRTVAGFRDVPARAGDSRVRPSIMFAYDMTVQGVDHRHYICIYLARNIAATTGPSFSAYRNTSVKTRETVIRRQIEDDSTLHMVYLNVGEYRPHNVDLAARIETLTNYFDRTLFPNSVAGHHTLVNLYFTA